MSAYIKTLKNTDGDIIYPQTKTSAVYTNEGVNIESIFGNPALIDGSAPIIDTTMNINTDTLQGKNWSQMLTNRNLLDNWDFRNPVNQRNISSGVSASAPGYFLDRWVAWGTGVGNSWVSGRGLIINSSSGVLQYIEINPVELAGRIVTCSLLLEDGSVISGSVTMPTDMSSAVGVPGLNTNLGYEYRSAGVVINGVTSYYLPYIYCVYTEKAIKLIKLELGSVSTLANDPPADYGEELRKCQRYQFNPLLTSGQNYAMIGQGKGSDGNNGAFIQIPIPVTMRTVPVIETSGTFYISGVPVTSINVNANAAGVVTLGCLVGFSTITTSIYTLQASTGAKMILNSNL